MPVPVTAAARLLLPGFRSPTKVGCAQGPPGGDPEGGGGGGGDDPNEDESDTYVDEDGEVWTRVRRRRNRRSGGGDPPGDDPPGDGGDGGNPEGDPPSRREDTGRERRRRSHSRSSRSPNRLKEQNKVELPGFPQVATLSKYKADLLDAVLNCAQDKSPGVVLPWIMKVGEKGVKFEDLQEPGANFQTLDRKLAIALSKTLPQEFGRMVEVKRQRALREHKLLAGRQILWEIYRHLATSANQENLYSASDLMSIRWFGDSHKQAFMTMWEDRMSKTKGNVAVWVKTEVLEKCVKESTDLRFQWMQYEDKHRDELNDDNALERYDLLIDMIQRQVIKERKEVNLEKMQSADKRFKEQFIKTPAPKKAPAAPAPQGRGRTREEEGTERDLRRVLDRLHSIPPHPTPTLHLESPKGARARRATARGRERRETSVRKVRSGSASTSCSIRAGGEVNAPICMIGRCMIRFRRTTRRRAAGFMTSWWRRVRSRRRRARQTAGPVLLPLRGRARARPAQRGGARRRPGTAARRLPLLTPLAPKRGVPVLDGLPRPRFRLDRASSGSSAACSVRWGGRRGDALVPRPLGPRGKGLPPRCGRRVGPMTPLRMWRAGWTAILGGKGGGGKSRSGSGSGSSAARSGSGSPARRPSVGRSPSRSRRKRLDFGYIEVLYHEMPDEVANKEEQTGLRSSARARRKTIPWRRFPTLLEEHFSSLLQEALARVEAHAMALEVGSSGTCAAGAFRRGRTPRSGTIREESTSCITHPDRSSRRANPST